MTLIFKGGTTMPCLIKIDFKGIYASFFKTLKNSNLQLIKRLSIYRKAFMIRRNVDCATNFFNIA
jgi:hypothetical protein